MKRLLIILTLALVSCRKMDVPAPVPTVKDIFTVAKSTVTDGSEIVFNLKSSGTYTLTMIDSAANQVVTREKFTGKIGENKLKIYTKSLSATYLYLILEDGSKVQIGKTTIIIN
jgi:hypothetical protein